MWSCNSHTLFAGLGMQVFGNKGLSTLDLQFPRRRLRKKHLFNMHGKLAPETAADESTCFCGLPRSNLTRRRSRNQPAIHILLTYKRADSCNLRWVRVLSNCRMDHDEKTRETCGAKPFESKRGLKGSRRIQPNRQEQFAERLEFVNPPA